MLIGVLALGWLLQSPVEDKVAKSLHQLEQKLMPEDLASSGAVFFRRVQQEGGGLEIGDYSGNQRRIASKPPILLVQFDSGERVDSPKFFAFRKIRGRWQIVRIASERAFAREQGIQLTDRRHKLRLPAL